MPTIHPLQQGSELWHRMRAGLITCSELDNLLTPLWKPRESGQRETYLYRKLAEKLLGGPLESHGHTWAMDQGQLKEREALPFFELTEGVKVTRAGLVTTDDDRCACSPDGLIGEDGGLELKCPEPPQHLRYLLAGGVPKEYLAQVHGSLFVTGRKWWKFMSYSRSFPPLVVHVERDEKIIHAIRLTTNAFIADLDEKFRAVLALDTARARAKEEVA